MYDLVRSDAVYSLQTSALGLKWLPWHELVYSMDLVDKTETGCVVLCAAEDNDS